MSTFDKHGNRIYLLGDDDDSLYGTDRSGRFDYMLGSVDAGLVHDNAGRAGLREADGSAGRDVPGADAGTDMVRFNGTYAEYAIAKSATGFTVTHKATGYVTALASVERLYFDDLTAVLGGHGSDALAGTSRTDVMFGYGADDVLQGGQGDDRLYGQAGNDRLYGQAGDDILLGGAGNDVLNGGGGNDRLIGGSGDDVIDGGAGAADRAVFRDALENYTVQHFVSAEGKSGFHVTHAPTDGRPSDGVDTVYGIEEFEFAGAVHPWNSPELIVIAGAAILDLDPGDDSTLDVNAGLYRTGIDGPIDLTPLGAEISGDPGLDRLSIVVFGTADGGGERLLLNDGATVAARLLLTGEAAGTFSFGKENYRYDSTDHGPGAKRLTLFREDGELFGQSEIVSLVNNLSYENVSPHATDGTRKVRFGFGADGNDWPESLVVVDAPPKVTVDDLMAYESEGSATFTVRLSEALGTSFSIDYYTDFLGGFAQADDPRTVTGTLTFAAGQTEKTVTVDFPEDFTPEEVIFVDERIGLFLTNPQGGGGNVVVQDSHALVNILNDDFAVAENATVVGIMPRPQVNVNDAAYTITDDPSGKFEIDRRSGEIRLKEGESLDFETATQHQVGVSVATAWPYATHNVTVTINVTDVQEAGDPAPERIFEPVPMPDTDDIVVFGPGAAILDLDPGDDSTLDVNAGLYRTGIDGPIDLTPLGAEISGDPGLDRLSIVVFGTADGGGERLLLNDGATVAARLLLTGEAAGTFSFGKENYRYDSTDHGPGAKRLTLFREDGELFGQSEIVSLVNNLSYENVSPHATDGTRKVRFGFGADGNDWPESLVVVDAPPKVTVDDLMAYESEGSATFTVRLSEALGTSFSIDYYTDFLGGFAQADDPRTVTGTLTFAAGQTEKTVTVDFPEDFTPEEVIFVDERIGLFLTNPQGGGGNVVVQDSHALVNILNDDFAVAENATVVGIMPRPQVNVNDAAYTITDDPSGKFEIDRRSGEIRLKEGESLDFETATQHQVGVSVATAWPYATHNVTVTINVTDTNDAPTVALINAIMDIGEDADTSSPIKIADIVVSDQDAGTNTLGLAGADAALFQIVGNELFLKAGAVLDAMTNPLLDITVTVDDVTVGTTPDDTASLQITVVDINEAPTVALENISLDNIDEDADTSAAIKVADIVVTDDIPGNNVLGLAGADSALFEIVGSELFLKAGTVLDFETNPLLDVTVTVDDVTVGTTPDDSASLQIAVNDINEAPTVALANINANIPEDTDTSAAIKVADIVINDDAIGTNNLVLTGADATLFQIVGMELFLKAGTELDFETQSQFDVTVTVDDPTVGGTPDDTAPLTVDIIDVNEAPTVSLANVTTSLGENAGTGTPTRVADILVDDDALGTNIITLAGADAALFEIIGDGLFLKAGTLLDFETNPALDVTVVVDDPTVGGTPDDSASVHIDVTDVAEPTLRISSETLSETGGSMIFAVTRSGNLDWETSVDFATQDRTALNIGPGQGDYEATSGTATFGRGQQQAFITVAINDDGLAEGDESFRVLLSDAPNATIIEGLAPSAEFTVPNLTDLTQRQSALTTLENGNVVATWASFDPAIPGVGFKVEARLLSSVGTPLGPEFTVTDLGTAEPKEPRVTQLENGGFVIVWEFREGFGTPVTGLKVFNANGAPVTSQIELSGVSSPEVVGLANGGFVVSLNNGTSFQRFNNSGNEIGSPINSQVAAGGSMVALEDGGLAIFGESAGNVSAAIFNANGTLRVAPFSLAQENEGIQRTVEGAVLTGGRFVAVWESSDPDVDGGSLGIVGRIFNAATGTPEGNEFLINAGSADNDRDPEVTALNGGGFAVVWASSPGDDPSDSDIHVRVFDDSGAVVLEDILVTDNANEQSFSAAVTARPDGGFIVSWTGPDADDSQGVQAKAYPPIPGLGLILDNEAAAAAPSIDVIDGSVPAADYVVFEHSVGTAGLDHIVGTDADEAFATGAGSDVVDGGAGTDIFVLNGAAEDYFLAGEDYAGEGHYYVLSAEGQSHITGIEALLFAGSGEIVLLDGVGTIVGDGGFMRTDLLSQNLAPEDYAVFVGRAELEASTHIESGRDVEALALTDLLQLGDPGTVTGDPMAAGADYLLISGPSLDDLLAHAVQTPDGI